jgi:hypothetical protein
MTDDWYVAAIDNVDRAAQAAHAAIDRTVEALLEARQERIAGIPLVDIVDHLVARGGRETRRSADEAFREYADAVTAYRAATIRALVDQELLTMSEIARRTGVSRQMVARLYRSADPR